MRIIGGTHRGLTLANVGKGDDGAHLRPTADRVREAVFNVLLGGRLGDPVTDAQVLDLFAGTGALGLEALSRGADAATFVDDGRVAGRLIRDNISRMKANAVLLPLDARRLPVNTGASCNLVFLDPPYGKGLGLAALEQAAKAGWIAPGAVVVWEESTGQAAPPGFTLIEQRKYGEAVVTFLEAEG